MTTHSATGQAVVRALVAGGLAVVLSTLSPATAGAVEAQSLRVDVTEPSLLGEGSVLRPALLPGSTATYQLRLHNLRTEPVDVLVYGADADATGEVADGTDNEGVGGWITADETVLEVPAQGETTVDVTVARPGDDEEGGWGAVVAQLTDAMRRELSLDQIVRAAVLVEVAADGSGDGVRAEVVEQQTSGGLLPGQLLVDVRYVAADPGDPVPFDGSLVVSRPLGEDPTYEAATDAAPPGEGTITTVEVDLPWYGLVGRARAEAAVPGLVTSSAPVRIVVLPPWLALLFVVVAAAALWRARRDDTPFELGRVPARHDDEEQPAADDEDADEEAAADRADASDASSPEA